VNPNVFQADKVAGSPKHVSAVELWVSDRPGSMSTGMPAANTS